MEPDKSVSMNFVQGGDLSNQSWRKMSLYFNQESNPT